MEHKRLKQFPNYEIWEDGTVWRLPHRTINGTKLKLKKVKPYKAKNRYLEASLHNAEGKRVRMYLHRLVYMAFFGEIPPHKEIDHMMGQGRITVSAISESAIIGTIAKTPTALHAIGLQTP